MVRLVTTAMGKGSKKVCKVSDCVGRGSLPGVHSSDLKIDKHFTPLPCTARVACRMWLETRERGHLRVGVSRHCGCVPHCRMPRLFSGCEAETLEKVSQLQGLAFLCIVQPGHRLRPGTTTKITITASSTPLSAPSTPQVDS